MCVKTCTDSCMMMNSMIMKSGMSVRIETYFLARILIDIANDKMMICFRFESIINTEIVPFRIFIRYRR